jgi:hypothetical protein
MLKDMGAKHMACFLTQVGYMDTLVEMDLLRMDYMSRLMVKEAML